jgi:hypothetical protein
LKSTSGTSNDRQTLPTSNGDGKAQRSRDWVERQLRRQCTTDSALFSRCAKNLISPATSTLILLSTPPVKNIPLCPSGKSSLYPRAIPCPIKRGASRSSRNVGLRDAMDAVMSTRRTTFRRTVKSCGPDASTLASNG